jgi:hypothetical protein
MGEICIFILKMAYGSDRANIQGVWRECGKLVEIHTPPQGTAMECIILATIKGKHITSVESFIHIRDILQTSFPQSVWITFLNKTQYFPYL